MPDPLDPIAALNPFSRGVVHLTAYFKDPYLAVSEPQKLATGRDLFARLAIDTFLLQHDIILLDAIPTRMMLLAALVEFPMRLF